jgi:APA family basic amino acid/polyamine antiporter
MLAATILFIATNAGIIGASRITYSMASYRQLPGAFRKLHPKFKTPWLALVVFAGIASIIVLLPGRVDFLGTMYSFGAMLSFTVAHAAVVQLRRRDGDAELEFKARPNLRIRGVDWPVFAFIGGTATFLAWLVVVVKDAPTRWAGLSWLAAGLVVYVVYRRRVLHVPLTETVRAPALLGPALALEYQNILVPIVEGKQAREAMHVAARLAGERRAMIVALRTTVVPLDLPLNAELPDQDAVAERLLDEAHDIGDLYGVRVVERVVRDRSAGAAIVTEAERRNTEIIVMGAPRLPHRTRTSAIFGKTVDHVLRHASCRVMIGAARRAA